MYPFFFETLYLPTPLGDTPLQVSPTCTLFYYIRNTQYGNHFTLDVG